MYFNQIISTTFLLKLVIKFFYNVNLVIDDKWFSTIVLRLGLKVEGNPKIYEIKFSRSRRNHIFFL